MKWSKLVYKGLYTGEQNLIKSGLHSYEDQSQTKIKFPIFIGL